MISFCLIILHSFSHHLKQFIDVGNYILQVSQKTSTILLHNLQKLGTYNDHLKGNKMYKRKLQEIRSQQCYEPLPVKKERVSTVAISRLWLLKQRKLLRLSNFGLNNGRLHKFQKFYPFGTHPVVFSEQHCVLQNVFKLHHLHNGPLVSISTQTSIVK